MITFIGEEKPFDPSLIQELLNKEAICCPPTIATYIYLDLTRGMDVTIEQGHVNSHGWKVLPYYCVGFITIAVKLEYRVIRLDTQDEDNIMIQVTSIKVERE